MTTQAILITLIAKECSRLFYAAAQTDAAAFAEVTSKTGNNSLHDTNLKGKTIVAFRGEFAAAIGAFRIRNTATNKVKTIQLLDQLGETRTRVLSSPVVVEDNDVLEAYCDVA
jgi:Trk-type K+ transport system membrane component